MRRAWMVTCALSVLAWLSGCEDVNPTATDAAVTPGEDMTVSPPDGSQVTCDPVKVDLLWVVDDSTSMCQEQAALADGFAAFVERLALYGHIDLRTAVTTTAVLVDGKGGRFNQRWAEEFPPLCQAERLFPASSDLDCACAACADWDAAYAWQRCQDRPGDPGCTPPPAEPTVYTGCRSAGGCPARPHADLWVWEPPIGGLESTYNLNGSVNSTCQLRCGDGQPTVAAARDVGTQVCRDWFGGDDWICQVPDLRNTGCLRPPATEDCPADLPTVLPAGDGHGLELFRCIAVVGTDQSTAANLEGGFAAAWLALSPEGPEPVQICEPDDPALEDPLFSLAEKREQCARRFLREDAWLVIAFLTDEDDCTLADEKRIVAEDYNRCALLGDAETAPGVEAGESRSDPLPLATVTDFVERFRSLRPDPQKVVVAAFAGDVYDPSHVLSAAALEAERALYWASKTERTNRLALNTSVASGPNGRADLGARYIRLVAAFGDRGFFHNIVADLPAELAALADEIGGLVSTCE